MKKGYGTLFTIVGINSVTTTVNKLTFNVMPPYIYLAIRYLGIMLLSLVIKKRGTSEKGSLKRDINIIFADNRKVVLLMVSLMLSVLTTILYYSTFKYLPVTLIAVMDYGIQLITVSVLSIFMFNERKTLLSWLFIFTTVMGLYTVVVGGEGAMEVTIVGVAIMIVNSVLTGVDSVVTTKLLKYISVNSITTLKMFFCVVFMVILSGVTDEPILDTFKHITPYTIGLIAFATITGYISKVLMSTSLKNVGASKTTLFMSFIPIASTIVAMFIFKEWLTALQWLGVIVTAVSILLVNKQK